MRYLLEILIKLFFSELKGLCLVLQVDVAQDDRMPVEAETN